MGETNYDELRAQTVSSGQDEEAVTVNTRALIDKVLARYSGEWTVLRELLQNAADASASRVTIKYETIPSITVPVSQDLSPSALIKHTMLHHKLKRLVVTNNGKPFSGNDWSRLKRIAEGNPDETKIGAFGVGFYSVFAECEEPLVRSHNEAMAFYWKGNSLFTRTSKLSNKENTDTSFILDYRNKTTAIPGLEPLCHFLASSLTFVGISDVELLLDDWSIFKLRKTTAPSRAIQIPRSLSNRTKDGLFKINSLAHETSQLTASWLKVIGWKPKASVDVAHVAVTNRSRGLQSLWNSITQGPKSAAAEKAAKAEREAEVELLKDLLGKEQATAFLHVTTAQLTSFVDRDFAKELERATKKPPPKHTHVALLTASHDEMELSISPENSAPKRVDVFANVLPRSSGRIFIGFPTHQTTGFGAHISAPSVIPTVERESIDLNARWVRTWNEEILRAVGLVARIAWSEESKTLKKRLDDLVKASESMQLLPKHITKVLPQALHNMNQFDFSESTPSVKVGNHIEEAFWGCDESGGLDMDLLCTRGVLPSQDIRLGTDDLSFLEGIPFLPKEVTDKQPALIKKLISVGIITPVVISDIKRELERQSLNSQQLIEFLQWVARRVSTKEIDVRGAASLFKVTVADDSENNKIIQLASISNYQNPNTIPAEMPVPSNTIPYKFTRNINQTSLAGLGWKELQIVPWTEFLLDNARAKENGKQFDVDHQFAALVLPAISKHWKGLSESSRQTIIRLMSDRTVIPTKMGMKKPSEAYFRNVKLFEDLPNITVSNASEAFLAALGVRKTIELNLVFDRLLNPGEKGGTSSPWSHVELIKYLTSVQADIPASDVQKLRKTAICTAEGEKDGQKFLLSELFEPKDELRPLQVKFVAWPGTYRPNAEESKFMRSLGLQTHPTIEMLVRASASTKNDPALREYALRYLVNFQHQHGYPISEIAKVQIPFLPVEGSTELRCTPSTCFTNPKVALFGRNVLRQDLHLHATKLGVSKDPSMAFCVDWLLANPPKSHRATRELFEYFASRMMELDAATVERLSQASIVPIVSSDATSEEKAQSLRRLPPTMCFLGTGGRYSEILDYVDFGDAANTFLMRCGSKPEPTSLELARRVIQEPARILDTLNNPARYLALLKRVAEDWASIKRDKALVRQMKESPFLLASVDRPREFSEKITQGMEDDDEEDQEAIKSWRLAKADEIVVVDDPIDYSLFRTYVLAAPQEEDLETLYLALSASKLSSVVTQSNQIGGRLRETESAERTKKLVVERVRLFLSDLSKDQIRHDGNWVERNLDFVAVSGIVCRKALKRQYARGHHAAHSLQINAIYDRSQESLLNTRHIIYFKPGVRDLYHLGQSICHVCLNKSTLHQVMVLNSLLDSNLRTLQARGYNVSRILKRKQAEDKIQQEENKRRLEEERTRMMAAAISEKQPNSASSDDERALMPGVFPDTPEATNSEGKLGPQRDVSQDQQPLLSTFKERMRDMLRGGSSQGFISRPDDTPESGTVIENNDGNQELTRRTQHPPSRGEVKPQDIRDTASLQAKLEQTVKASKPYNAGALSSVAMESMIRETPSFCDSRPAQNVIQQGRTNLGIKIFCARTMVEPARFLGANGNGLELFGTVLLQIARAMEVPRAALHIFHDDQSESIAFNAGRALFFNYHYFEGMHLAQAQQGRLDSAIVYWFTTMCHEVTHNACPDHGPEFNFWMQHQISMHFGAIGKLLRYDGESPPPAPRGRLEDFFS